jgi:hypothetical protein
MRFEKMVKGRSEAESLEPGEYAPTIGRIVERGDSDVCEQLEVPLATHAGRG